MSLKKYFLLAALTIGPAAASSLQARDSDRSARKIERYARRIARQTDRLVRESTKMPSSRLDECRPSAAPRTACRPTSSDAPRGYRNSPLEKTSEKFTGHPQSQPCRPGYAPTRHAGFPKDECLSRSLRRTLAELPAPTRRKIRRVLKELPESVQEIPAVRTTQDVLKHPRRYRPSHSCDAVR